MTGPRCSVLSGALGEPLAGTAAVASSWLCVEQPGPWGRDALRESHLDSGVAAALAERVAGTGVRIVLIRRPGPHPDRHRPVPRTVFVAHTVPGSSWLERLSVADPKELLDLDLAAIGAGTAPGWGARRASSLLLVCTNSKRDMCCAISGRPIATALAGEFGDAVWECTHIGGHRFAPTGLVLPSGYSHGRLDLATARALVDGSVVAGQQCRGRSTWDQRGQVAELAVRETLGERDPDALSVLPEPAEGRVLVRHRDGRAWLVTVVERAAGPDRRASCGAADTPMTAWVALDVLPR